MKMDAMQKRRMWKVATVHFALTIVVGLLLLDNLPFWHSSASEMAFLKYKGIRTVSNMADWNNHVAAYGLQKAQFNICSKISIMLLQPQAWLLDRLSVSDSYLFLNGDLARLMKVFISIPFWSICFGWLYVKLDNWLNHFPVLGKRVF